MKKIRLRERAFRYYNRSPARLSKTHDETGRWMAGYASGTFDGYLAGFRAAVRLFSAPGTRTTHRSKIGTKLYAVRDKKGKFKDIQTYKRAHAQDLRRKSRSEE